MNENETQSDRTEPGAGKRPEEAAPAKAGGAEAGSAGSANVEADQGARKTRAKATGADISAAFESAAGGGGDGGGSRASDEAGSADATRQAHSESVYNGRLGAAMRENNDLKRQVAELKRRNAELEAAAAGGGGGAGGGADDGDDGFDEATRRGIDRIVDRRTRSYEERIGQMDAELREYRDGARRRAFAETQARSAESVERRFPGLLHDIAGTLRERWGSFCRTADPITGTTFGQSLHDATGRGSEAGAVRVFAEFVETEGLGGRFAAGGGAFDAPPSRSPNPAEAGAEGARGGGEGGKVWPSREAILEAMDKVQRDERRGAIDRAERVRRMDKLDDDLRSGRYLRRQ